MAWHAVNDDYLNHHLQIRPQCPQFVKIYFSCNDGGLWPILPSLMNLAYLSSGSQHEAGNKACSCVSQGSLPHSVSDSVDGGCWVSVLIPVLQTEIAWEWWTPFWGRAHSSQPTSLVLGKGFYLSLYTYTDVHTSGIIFNIVFFLSYKIFVTLSGHGDPLWLRSKKLPGLNHLALGLSQQFKKFHLM